MKTLRALLVGVFAVVGVAATGLYLLRRREGSWGSATTSAKDTATSWGRSAADQASHAADQAHQAADKVAAVAEDAAESASSVAENMKTKRGADDA